MSTNLDAITTYYEVLPEVPRLQELSSCCTNDMVAHLSSGKKQCSLQGFVEEVQTILGHLSSFEHRIISTVSEEKGEESLVAIRSQSRATTKESPGNTIEFFDFTMFRLNSEGKIAEIWQGAATYYHLYSALA